MSARLLLSSLILLASCTTPKAAPVPAKPASEAASPRLSEQATGVALETPLADGVRLGRLIETGETPLVGHIVSLDLTRQDYAFAVTPADHSRGMEHVAKLTTAVADETNAVIAINASYFLPFAGGSAGGDDFYPKVGDPVNVSGAALSGGVQVSPVETDIDIRVNAIVCFSGARIRIEDGQTCPTGFPDGVAAGPRLLAAGEQRSFAAFDNNYAVSAHPRTAIGVSADRTRGWIVVLDGRQKGYSAGASLAQLAKIFLELGASDAINLDGGGSTTLAHAPASGGAILLNRPIHSNVPGRERPVANHILLLPANR